MEEKENQSNEAVKRKAKRYTANPWYHHSFFQYAVGILLVLMIMWLFSHVSVFLIPFVDFISTLFTPVIISLLFYYLLRPIVYFAEGYNVPRVITILCIYILIALGIVFFVAYIGPILTKQISALADTSVATFEQFRERSRSILFRFFNIDLDYEIEQRLFSIAQQVTTVFSKNVVDFIAFITRLATILAVIPFIVFYLLKDDRDFSYKFLVSVPEDFGLEIRKTLRNMDLTLANYITGLVLISCSVGALLFIGYLIIGLNYALILSLIALVLTSIPFLGPFLSIAPAILVGLAESPWMVVKVIIVFIIVQQLEGNLISPQIIGQRLNIHPLTIILLLVAAGTLYGLIGLILITPLYALAKVLIENLYKIYVWHYSYSKKRKS